MKGRVRTLAVVLAVVGISAAAVLGATATTNRSASKQTAAAAHGKPPGPTNCGLRHNVKHVVYLIFDNVHFLRDNPNVPSDLEQMPHLLNFIRGNGTLLTNDHTVLISHTGERDPHQPDRHVLRPARPGGGELVPLLQERRLGHDALVELVQVLDRPDGRRRTPRRSTRTTTWSTADSGTNKNAPAPWVPYTRAGCDWGATALANVVLENTGTGPAGDMTKVFGSGSPEWNEAVASNAAPAGTAARNLAQTDFVGIAIHCAQTRKSICHDNANAKADQLPDEPGGYAGYQGLFGAKYVNPAICPANPSNCTNATANGQLALKKLDGTRSPTSSTSRASRASTACSPRRRSRTSRRCRRRASRSRSATSRTRTTSTASRARSTPRAARARPTTSSSCTTTTSPSTSSSTGWPRDGITKKNTLFVFNVEEGDHFAGAIPTPAGCDGVTVAVPLQPGGRGQRQPAGPAQDPAGDHDAVHDPLRHGADAVPERQPGAHVRRRRVRSAGESAPCGRRTRTPASTRTSPRRSPTRWRMKTLHMVTADPQRTPTLTMFALPDYFLFASSAACDEGGTTPSCITVPTTPPTNTFAWNHGGIQPEIAHDVARDRRPGRQELGDDSTTWADHSDTRPTMLSLLGLNDTYVHDGAVFADAARRVECCPVAVRQHLDTYERPSGLQAAERALRRRSR